MPTTLGQIGARGIGTDHGRASVISRKRHRGLASDGTLELGDTSSRGAGTAAAARIAAYTL